MNEKEFYESMFRASILGGHPKDVEAMKYIVKI
jgi:hypothetical protein